VFGVEYASCSAWLSMECNRHLDMFHPESHAFRYKQSARFMSERCCFCTDSRLPFDRVEQLLSLRRNLQGLRDRKMQSEHSRLYSQCVVHLTSSYYDSVVC